MKISGKTAIITGGASGLGEATALMLAHEGANIVIVDINEEAGSALAETIGDKALFCKTDITSEEEAAAMISAAINRFGHIDICVSCAGIAPGAKIVGKKGPHDLGLFRKTIEINLIGTFNIMRLSAEKMMLNDPDEEGERGVIVNTASIAAFDGQVGQSAYAASKAGLVGLTLPVARDLCTEGIRICTIAPGIFNTPMMAALPQAVRDSLGKTIPFPSRLGKPSEYSMLARQIIENTMLNGEVIRLDGAIRMAPR